MNLQKQNQTRLTRRTLLLVAFLNSLIILGWHFKAGTVCTETRTYMCTIPVTDSRLKDLMKFKRLIVKQPLSNCIYSFVVYSIDCSELGTSGTAGLRVFVGIQKYSEKLSATAHSVTEIHKHPGYKDLQNDVALVKVCFGRMMTILLEVNDDFLRMQKFKSYPKIVKSRNF